MQRQDLVTMSEEEFDEIYTKVWSIYESIDNGEGRVIVELFADIARTALEVLAILGTDQTNEFEDSSQDNNWKATAFNSEVATGHSCNSSWPNFIYFNDGADSDPHHVIHTGKQRFRDKTGTWPNTLIIGPEVRHVLMFHPDASGISEWEKYTKEVLKSVQTGIVDPVDWSPYRISLLAELLCLDQIIVDDDFGKDMLLCYVSEEEEPTHFTGILFKNAVC